MTRVPGCNLCEFEDHVCVSCGGAVGHGTRKCESCKGLSTW